MDGLLRILGGEATGQPPDLEAQVLADTAVRKVIGVGSGVRELRQAVLTNCC